VRMKTTLRGRLLVIMFVVIIHSARGNAIPRQTQMLNLPCLLNQFVERTTLENYLKMSNLMELSLNSGTKGGVNNVPG